jgi:BASS family bile acid:Na+ symporter
MNLQTLIPIVLKVSLLLSVFAIGLKASAQDATYLFRRPGELVRAIVAMNVLMPVFAVAVVLLFDLNQAVRIALVALSVSPIPPLLPNKMVKQGSTDSYAIGLLIAAGLLSIIFVPLSMKILKHGAKVPLQMPIVSVATLIFMTILLPIGLGVAVHTFAPALTERLAKPISQIAGIGLLLALLAILFSAAPAIWALIGNGTVIAFAAFVLVGLAIGHILGGPKPENRTALAISTSSRHPGVAIALAAANFPEEKLATASVLLYLLVGAVASIPYLKWNKRQHPDIESQPKATEAKSHAVGS